MNTDPNLEWKNTLLGQLEALIKSSDEALLKGDFALSHATLMQSRTVMDLIKYSYHDE